MCSDVSACFSGHTLDPTVQDSAVLVKAQPILRRYIGCATPASPTGGGFGR